MSDVNQDLRAAFAQVAGIGNDLKK